MWIPSQFAAYVPIDSASSSTLAEAFHSVNHYGVAITGVHRHQVDIITQPSKFECVAAHIASGWSNYLIVMIYCTCPVTANFVKLSILDRLTTTGDQLVLAGNVNINIHLKRALDTITAAFIDLLACYDLVQHVTGATHDASGTIKVICTRRDLPSPTVDVIFVGHSNHRLLRWASRLHHPPPIYTPSTCRIWRLFDAAAFRTLSASVLCDE